MKLVELRNVTASRIVIKPVRGFVVDAGKSIKVHPATVKHPTVASYIRQKSLVVVETVATVAAPPPPPPAPPKPAEPKPPVVEEKEVPKIPEPVVEEKKAEEPAEKDLKDLYLAAPGITEENLEVILEKFPTIEKLAEASKSDLVDCGISRTYVARLRQWAKEQ